MYLRFVPKSHLFFTAGKDRKIKQWDADKFEHIQTLEVTSWPTLMCSVLLLRLSIDFPPVQQSMNKIFSLRIFGFTLCRGTTRKYGAWP